MNSKVGQAWEVSLSRMTQVMTPLELNIANLEDAENEYTKWRARQMRNQLITGGNR